MKNIKFLVQFRQGTKAVIATTIMGIALISASGINSVNYNSSTSSVDKYIQVFASVYTTQYGATTSTTLSVRTGAGENYSSVGDMKIGTKVVMIGKTNNFYKIIYAGNTRYISAQYVKITAKPVVAVVVALAPVVVYKTQVGVSTGEGISIRTGPGTQYSWQGGFHLGEKLNILGTSGSFYKVSYSGKTGYVSKQYVKLVAAVEPTPATISKILYGVTTASVSIRTGAHINYSVQGTFANGTRINITGVAGPFYRVNYNGKTGYISNQYVKLVAAVEPTPATINKILYGVTTASVSIRTGAHINYSVQGTFANGTKIDIIGVAGTFYRVSYSGKTGYISNQYVKLVTATVDAPVVVPPVVNPATESEISTTTSFYNYSLDLLTDIQYGLKDALTDINGMWLLAEKTQIRYYADPLNAQSTEQKYQFLKLCYTDGISASEINSVVQGKGVLNQEGTVILNSCKTSNVNPAYLISHACLETGNGSSDLANGIIVTQVNGLPVIPKVVYNLFGIGAYDASPSRLGSEYAYINGWFTVEQAIVGGANWISKYYINNATNKQNTLYKMRWNPYTTGTHQYATDIGWASKQTKNIKAIMDKFTNANLYFEIPQYELK